MPSPASERLTRAHNGRLATVSNNTGRAIRRAAGRVDTVEIDEWWSRVSPDVVDIVSRAATVTADITGDYLEDHARLNGARVSPTVAYPDPEQIHTSLRVTGPIAFKQSVSAGNLAAEAERSMMVRLLGSARRLTLEGGRRSTMATVQASTAIAGYQRLASADACGFCLMLESRGAVYKSGATAGQAGATGRLRGTQEAGSSFHDNCRCSIEPHYEVEPPSDKVRDLHERWREVTEGYSGREALQVWRAYLGR